MSDTTSLIDSLARRNAPVKPMWSPGKVTCWLLIAFAAYMVVVLSIIGPRGDLAVELQNPPFVAELLLLAAVSISGLIASVYGAYPDRQNHYKLWSVPIISLILLVAVLALRAHGSVEQLSGAPAPSIPHLVECALCLGAFSIAPGAILFYLVKRGASVHPVQSGITSMLAATFLACILLRAIDMENSLLHLATAHYLPTLIFTGTGAFLGKLLLKW